MTTLGVRAASGELVLQRGGDFLWQYVWTVDRTPAPFPAGSKLDLLIGAEVYPFAIAGTTASIKIEAEVCDVIKSRTPWRLRFTEATVPTTETILAHGLVERDDPQGLK